MTEGSAGPAAPGSKPATAGSGVRGSRAPRRTNAGTGQVRDVEVRRGGEPTEDEVAAIVAAVETMWSPASEPARPPGAPRWRFSGRWWSKPVPLRRTRPW